MAGDTWAIAETWRRFAPMVLMMAKRTLGSQCEAEDIGQEVFHRLFRNAKTLRAPDSLRSFVYAFTIRALKSRAAPEEDCEPGSTSTSLPPWTGSARGPWTWNRATCCASSSRCSTGSRRAIGWCSSSVASIR